MVSRTLFLVVLLVDLDILLDVGFSDRNFVK